MFVVSLNITQHIKTFKKGIFKMIDSIKKLSASVGGYMGYSFSVAIDFKKASAKYKVYECGYKAKSSETVLLSESK